MAGVNEGAETTDIAGDVFDAIGPDSWALQVFERLIPGVMSPENAESILATDGWQNALFAFNGALLTLASMFLVWNLFAGLIDAAREGRPFGNRAHVAWGPMRAVAGIGLIAPIPGMGWCLGQALVLLVGVLGTSLGTNVWSHAVSAVFKVDGSNVEGAPINDISGGSSAGVNALVQPVSVNNKRSIVANTLKKEACYAYLRQSADNVEAIRKAHLTDAQYVELWSSKVNGLPKNPPIIPGSSDPGAQDGTILRGWDYGPVCGKQVYRIRSVTSLPDNASEDQVAEMEARRAFDVARANALSNVVARLRGQPDATTNVAPEVKDFVPQEVTSTTFGFDVIEYLRVRASPDESVRHLAEARLVEMGLGAIKTLPENLYPWQGQNYAEGEKPPVTRPMVIGYIKAVEEMYEAEMKAAARRYQKTRAREDIEAFVTASNEAGWMSAGATFLAVSSVQHVSSELANQGPTSGPVHLDRLPEDGPSLQTLSRQFVELETMRQKVDRAAVFEGVRFDDIMQVTTPQTDAPSTLDDVNRWLGDMVRQVGNHLFGGMDSYTGMVSTGHDVMNASENVLMSVFSASLLGEAASDIPFVGDWINQMTDIGALLIGLPAVVTWGIGALFAYVMPWLPFAYWVFAIVGFVFAFVEAVILIPLWAVMSAQLEGDKFLHEGQRTGVMLLFNVFMRPVLAVFGLLAGFAALVALTGVLDKLFTVGGSVASFGEVGVVPAVIAFVLVGYLHWYLATRCLSLIHNLPQRVGDWMGIPARSDQNEGSDSGAITGALAGYGAGAVGYGLSGAQGAQTAVKTVSNKMQGSGRDTTNVRQDT
jgi:conjugal transfer/type IV secretion protein DotA/TraY